MRSNKLVWLALLAAAAVVVALIAGKQCSTVVAPVDAGAALAAAPPLDAGFAVARATAAAVAPAPDAGALASAVDARAASEGSGTGEAPPRSTTADAKARAASGADTKARASSATVDERATAKAAPLAGAAPVHETATAAQTATLPGAAHADEKATAKTAPLVGPAHVDGAAAPKNAAVAAKTAVVADAGPARVDVKLAAKGAPVKDAVHDAGVVALVAESAAEVPFTVAYTDELTAWLKLDVVRVLVDGKRLAEVKDVDAKATRVIYTGAVSPGTHTVRIETVYTGKSNGIFGYMEGYKFKVAETGNVVAQKKSTRVDAVAYDKGALQQWENRPAMKLTVSSADQSP